MKLNQYTTQLMSVLSSTNTRDIAEQAIALVIAMRLTPGSLTTIISGEDTTSKDVIKHVNAANEIVPLSENMVQYTRNAITRRAAYLNGAIMFSNLSTHTNTILNDYVEEEHYKVFIDTYKLATAYFIDFFDGNDSE